MKTRIRHSSIPSPTSAGGASSSAARPLRGRRRADASPARPSGGRSTSKIQQLLIIGRGRRAQSIQRRVEGLRVRVRSAPTVEEAHASLSDATSAVLLVEPLPEQRAVDAVHELTVDGRPWAVFVIVPEDYSDRRARRIYEKGAVAVFSWPREALVLPAMLTDLLRVTPRRGNKTADARLAHAVRSRLRLAEDAKISARIVGGVVTLRGHVSSYWRKTRLVDTLSQLPGVRSVHCEDVLIVPTKRPDKELRRDVRNVLHSVAGVDGRTLAVAAEDGIVSLRGTVSRYGELERMMNVVGNVEGVRELQSNVVISASTEKARGMVSRIHKKIEGLFPTARANVTVFGYIAILNGHVSTLRDKRGIEDLTRDTPGVGRVVNKLTVNP